MKKTSQLGLLISVIALACFFSACAKAPEAEKATAYQLDLVGEVKDIPPATPLPSLSIPMGNGTELIKKAGTVPVFLAAYGAGGPICFDYALISSEAQVSQAGLARTVLSAAMGLRQHLDSIQENRDAVANIYPVYTMSGEYNVLLASAVVRFMPGKNPNRYRFPGPAWKKVVTVECVSTRQELTYIQTMQRLFSNKSDREDIPNQLTAEHDAQIAQEMKIAPGSIKIKPFILRSLLP